MTHKDIEQSQDRLLNLADEIGLGATLSVLREWRLWDSLLDAVADDVIDAGLAADKDELDDANELVARLEGDIVAQDQDMDRLHAAICEGRRDDAIDILNSITGDRRYLIREQSNLFPDRVPA